jgi:2-C-methyl-D-erythritol 4-phosphate cytidylyltransferase
VPKAFVNCAGRELWEWSADTMREVCDRVVIAAPPDRADARAADRAVPQIQGLSDPGSWVRGGEHRSESVRNALAVAPDAEIVVVHDAARPFASAELFRACIAAIEAGADAAIAAAPVTDTIKEADADRRVTRTLDRSRLWSIQTPQAFRAEILRRALEGDVANATDDAMLVEALGGDVRIVEAPASNFKVTWPEDLARAESLLC